VSLINYPVTHSLGYWLTWKSY